MVGAAAVVLTLRSGSTAPVMSVGSGRLTGSPISIENGARDCVKYNKTYAQNYFDE